MAEYTYGSSYTTSPPVIPALLPIVFTAALMSLSRQDVLRHYLRVHQSRLWFLLA
jgi:hypothetical protein